MRCTESQEGGHEVRKLGRREVTVSKVGRKVGVGETGDFGPRRPYSKKRGLFLDAALNKNTGLAHHPRSKECMLLLHHIPRSPQVAVEVKGATHTITLVVCGPGVEDAHCAIKLCCIRRRRC